MTVALAAVLTAVVPGATAIEYGLSTPVAAAVQPDVTAVEYA
jgi:hypothetical protein